MDYCTIEFDGQPLATISASRLVGVHDRSFAQSPQVLTIGAQIVLPAIDVSNIVLTINSFEEAHHYVLSQRPMKVEIVDTTYPHTPAAQLVWAKAIVRALLNQDNAVDGEKLMKQWISMIETQKVNAELVAWKLLKRVMLYHNVEGKLEPKNEETSKAPIWTNFAEHMNYIINALMTKKTLCRHLATDIWTATFIDAPAMHSLRVDSNRRINDIKRAKVDAGLAAVEHVKKTIEQGNAIDSDDDAVLKALIAAVPESAHRTRRNKRNESSPVTPRPRSHVASTPRKQVVKVQATSSSKVRKATPRKTKAKPPATPTTKLEPSGVMNVEGEIGLPMSEVDDIAARKHRNRNVRVYGYSPELAEMFFEPQCDLVGRNQQIFQARLQEHFKGQYPGMSNMSFCYPQQIPVMDTFGVQLEPFYAYPQMPANTDVHGYLMPAGDNQYGAGPVSSSEVTNYTYSPPHWKGFSGPSAGGHFSTATTLYEPSPPAGDQNIASTNHIGGFELVKSDTYGLPTPATVYDQE